MHGSLEMYDNWKDATYKSQRHSLLSKICAYKPFIHIDNHHGSDDDLGCRPS